MEDNKKISLTELINEVLGEDFDAEKVQALESKISSHYSQTTVPKSVFNTTNTKLKELKAKVLESDEKQQNVVEYDKKLEELTNSYEARLKEKDNAFNDFKLLQALKDSKARNPKAVKALLNLEKLTFENDGIKGLEEQIEALKKGEDSFLFDIPANAVKKGTDFPSNPVQPTGETKTINKII